ncbi:hypothetical protein ACIBCR_14830 [Micromonospora echinospora]|uniref:hypothetical protein n=1 Tax=Micromonospora echinospora TaxID=1877 RepID=UPI003791E245
MTGDPLRVGDNILVAATVKKNDPQFGVLIELDGTDHYTLWVPDGFRYETVVPNLPVEPADGLWVAGVEPGGTNTRVFIRNDAEGHNDPDRRHHRHWWDVAAEEWIDWPTAVKRGADSARVLRTETTR